jgi:hypothetical protein
VLPGCKDYRMAWMLIYEAAQVSGKVWFSKPIYQRCVESRPLARNIKRAAWLQKLPDGMDAYL